MKRLVCRLVLVGFILALAIAPALAEKEAREEAVVAPYEVYTAMLKYIELAEYAKVGKSLKLIDPLVVKIKKDYRIDAAAEIKSAIDREDEDEILYATRKLIYWSMVDLLDDAVGLASESPKKAKSNVRLAYADYLLLSPAFELKADARIKKAFQGALVSLGGETAFGVQKANPQLFKSLTQGIKDEILTLFPGFRPPAREE